LEKFESHGKKVLSSIVAIVAIMTQNAQYLQSYIQLQLKYISIFHRLIDFKTFATMVKVPFTFEQSRLEVNHTLTTLFDIMVEVEVDMRLSVLNLTKVGNMSDFMSQLEYLEKRLNEVQGHVDCVKKDGEELLELSQQVERPCGFSGS
jgi:hypothetical protein